MDDILNSHEVAKLAIIIEEATRSSKEGVKRFIEPAQGTLERAKSKWHHIVFGRRGSGKSSLLQKAAADLTNNSQPNAYIDLETFKSHSYPDVLLSILIASFNEFEDWFNKASNNSNIHDSSWQRIIGFFKPKPEKQMQKKAKMLAQKLHKQTEQLNKILHSADNAETQKTVIKGKEVVESEEGGANFNAGKIGVNTKYTGSERVNEGEEVKEAFQRSKIEFLHQNILEYQLLFHEISDFSSGGSYLFLDDLYHIPRANQAKVIDYFHRIAKGNGLWLKIGTIRHRTQWYIHGDPPTGVKLGDDAEDIDLDLTLEKYELTKSFLRKILKNFFNECGNIKIEDLLVEGAVDRLVLASGGVTRDFLGIFRRSIDGARERGIGGMGRRGRGHKITIEDVNRAIGEYESTKREEFKRDTIADEDSKLDDEFQKVRNFCLTEAKVNLFLIEKDITGVGMSLIQELVDLRLIHKVRSRVTVSKRSGKIFEAYMLDASQYTGSRKMRDMNMIEFWRPDSIEELRRVSMIYNPS